MTSESQNSRIIDYFVEAAIDWILTNQKIPETLPELFCDVYRAEKPWLRGER